MSEPAKDNEVEKTPPKDGTESTDQLEESPPLQVDTSQKEEASSKKDVAVTPSKTAIKDDSTPGLKSVKSVRVAEEPNNALNSKASALLDSMSQGTPASKLGRTKTIRAPARTAVGGDEDMRPADELMWMNFETKMRILIRQLIEPIV